MTRRQKPRSIPVHVNTVTELEAYADQVGLDPLQLLWAWGTATDMYHFAHQYGISAPEMFERLVRYQESHQEAS